MLQIKKGDFTIKVTPGAYQAYYRGLGFSPLFEPVSSSGGLNHPKHQFTQVAEQKAHTEPLSSSVEEVEDVLMGMNREQLYEYANLLGLDISGVDSLKELRELIRENSEEV